ncbi:MAG TPA: hypothetical protein VMG12_00595 [Polyangiaceae bacterium]|nr:hypothetical protein [Polyangiaceae bacterium]
MSLDTAIELPDYANVAGIPGEPYVWLGYDPSPIIERWDQRSASDNGGRGRVPFFALTAEGSTPAFTGIGSTGYMLRIR